MNDKCLPIFPNKERESPNTSEPSCETLKQYIKFLTKFRMILFCAFKNLLSCYQVQPYNILNYYPKLLFLSYDRRLKRIVCYHEEMVRE